ncbi:hypothetical protein Ccrd_023099 [Cynara cardunculus var. scolymus]|uniref:Uncharacterized protein n=1 Tax=Cynara cardunculus var. scolymus TaxID=59895 RepID=A0A124SE14_CYNCS|nr:hypothetical protein Ccrd_023099 [Cynara cardunculus var. scolymus]
MLSPLSQFWTSPTVIAEVDRESNERTAITAKGVGCNTDPKLLEKVKMTSLEAQLESVGRVRSRGIDECETWASKLHRPSQTDIDTPAFDLGISPSKEEVIACVGSSKAIGGHENVISTMPKRDPKLSFKLHSLYVTRAVMFEVNSDERKLQDWILRGIGRTLVVSTKIIDVWSMVLNREERLRSNESPRRYFVQTDISMDAIIRDEDLNVNQRYDRFRKNITSCMNNDKELISMRNVDLQDMMIMHLLKEGHGAWKVYAEMDQDHIKTRWQFRENIVDAGVMLIHSWEETQ